MRTALGLVLLAALPLLAATPPEENEGHARRQPDMSPGFSGAQDITTVDMQAFGLWSFLYGNKDAGMCEGPMPDAIIDEAPYYEPTK
jgi:hypothetical protein